MEKPDRLLSPGCAFTKGKVTPSHEDVSHQAISSYFIGPQAENLAYFKDNISTILEELRKARVNYFPEDGEFITESIQTSTKFRERTDDLSRAVKNAAQLLGQHSIPFWSPRYQGHMCMDMNMPALLGYFMTMTYNPNNVAFEASPLTSLAEIEVGQQLSELFGYNINENDPGPTAWGHIPCDGSVANLESMWVARNLKFYPLSLRQAMQGPLSFVADSFKIRTCTNQEKLFTDLSTWELLNLEPGKVLDLPDRLNKEYGISSRFMEKLLHDYSIQSRGKSTTESDFGIDQPIQYMLANTRHYSWPKGAAITGIGSDNMVGIPVDHGARVDLKELEKHLEENLQKKQAVYAVVAIIGSTEEGAVDRLGEILAMRKRFQARGLSFLVHADAAWGGYFATMLPKDYSPGSIVNIPADLSYGDGFVPDSPLRAQTQEDLFALRYADSITVDPHKAGYIPYPAGGLCYRDGRMRYLVTWTSPYLSQGATSSIGIYGVEGSKPGAAAMSTWLSNKCIGLGPEGYGSLLGEVTFTCSRLSAHWAAMTDDKMPFVVVPFNLLPSELEPDATAESVEAEKQRIRAEILSKSNTQIVLEDRDRPDDQKTMTLLRNLGSDLNINAFACNFRYSDGTLNKDTLEANYMMQRIVQRLSVDEPEDDPTAIPMYLTSTEFSPELYGECAENFKKRLGLSGGAQDLFVLRNVVMSPFPTERDFIGNLAEMFKNVVMEEAEVCRKRNEVTSDYHHFLLEGTDTVHLIHCPSFHVANHRRQLIISVNLPRMVQSSYSLIKRANPEEVFSFVTHERVNLSEVLETSGVLRGAIKTDRSGIIIPWVELTVQDVIKDRHLNGMYLDQEYPADHMPFYLYGTEKEKHIDHALLKSPNIQLSAENVSLELDGDISEHALRSGALLFLKGIYEDAMQPFASTADLKAQPNFFFRPGQSFDVAVYSDPLPANFQGPGALALMEQRGELLAEGKMTLREGVFVDSDAVNRDPYKKVEKYAKWREEFDKIGKKVW